MTVAAAGLAASYARVPRRPALRLRRMNLFAPCRARAAPTGLTSRTGQVDSRDRGRQT